MNIFDSKINFGLTDLLILVLSLFSLTITALCCAFIGFSWGMILSVPAITLFILKIFKMRFKTKKMGKGFQVFYKSAFILTVLSLLAWASLLLILFNLPTNL